MDDEIKKQISLLREMQADHTQIGMEMLRAYGGKLYFYDLFTSAALNRSTNLIDGFCLLIENNNYLCAAPLVRMQLDNVLRIYASSLVDDVHDFSRRVFEGIPIRKIKDKNKNRLTDRFLIDEISKKYPWMKNVYDATSGFVHLSDKHIYSIFENEPDDKNRSVQISIGKGDDHIPLEIKKEAVEGFTKITEIFLSFIRSWVIIKDNPDILKGSDEKTK